MTNIKFLGTYQHHLEIFYSGENELKSWFMLCVVNKANIVKFKSAKEQYLSLTQTKCSRLTNKQKRKNIKTRSLNHTSKCFFTFSPHESMGGILFLCNPILLCTSRVCNTGNKAFDTYLNRLPSSGYFYEGFKRNTFKCKSMYFISAAYLYCNYFC